MKSDQCKIRDTEYNENTVKQGTIRRAFFPIPFKESQSNMLFITEHDNLFHDDD